MAETPSPADPLRVGLVGAGFIGTRVGTEFARHPAARVVAVADVSESARTDAGDLFDASDALYESYETMLDGETLDAVLVGTPHTLHYEQVTAALDRDLHVLCDKPLTTDLDDARDLHERAEAGDRVVMVGYQRHLNPAFRRARDRWAASDADPQWLTAEVVQNWADRFRGTWRLDPSLSGGGFLYDTGSHLLDAVLWTTGLRPTAVSAHMEAVDDTGHDLSDDARRRVDERAELSVRFENGATATVATYGAAPCVREHIHVWDDDGATYLDGREWDYREFTELDAENGEHSPYVDNAAQRGKAEAFVDAVRGDADNPATTWDGVRVTAVTEAAYESAAADGAWVDVELGRQ